MLKSEQRSPLRNFDKKWQFKDHFAGNDGLGGGDDDGLGGGDDGGGCGRGAC